MKIETKQSKAKKKSNQIKKGTRRYDHHFIYLIYCNNAKRLMNDELKSFIIYKVLSSARLSLIKLISKKKLESHLHRSRLFYYIKC